MDHTEPPAEPAGAQYKRFFDAIPCPAWMFDDRSLRIAGANRAAVASYGFTRDEFLRMTLDQLAPEAERPALRHRMRLSKGGAAGVTHRQLTKDGVIIEVLLRWVGAPRTRSAMARGGTSLGWAERLPRGHRRRRPDGPSLPFDRAPVGLLCVDRAGLLLDVNAFGAELLQASKAQLVARPLRQLLADDAAGERLAALDALGGDDRWSGVLRLRRSDGTTLEAEAIAARADTDLVVLALQDAGQRVRTEGELRRSSDRYRRLSDRYRHVREEERARLARDLHDRLGQALTGLKMDLAWLLALCDRFEPTTARSAIAVMMDRVDTTIGVVRRIAGDLRPGVLDRLGLLAAIEWRASEFERRSGIRCRVCTSGSPSPLDQRQSTEVFRVFEEILTNVVRHARATRVRIRVKGERGKFALHVYDNGRGIPLEAVESEQSLGLIGMRERATLLGGTVTVSRGRRRGTLAVVRIPVAPRLVGRLITREVDTGVTEHD